jgi:sec-independent protein translocase protein TatC
MDDKRLPFTEHLRELRTRLRNAVIALLVGWVLAFWQSERLVDLLGRPYYEALKRAGSKAVAFPKLQSLAPTETFWVAFEISLWTGVFIASPFIFHQVWKFIAPGLYEKEKKVAIPFAVFSGLCFIGGGLFCFYLVLPAALDFLSQFGVGNLGHVTIESAWTLREYHDFAIRFLLAFGLVFELPLLIFFLSYVGLVTHKSLWRFNKYAVVVSFIVGAILTPGPDIVSQLFMALPLVVLYNLSIVIAFFVTKRKEKRDAEQRAAEAEADRLEAEAKAAERAAEDADE